MQRLVSDEGLSIREHVVHDQPFLAGQSDLAGRLESSNYLFISLAHQNTGIGSFLIQQTVVRIQGAQPHRAL